MSKQAKKLLAMVCLLIVLIGSYFLVKYIQENKANDNADEILEIVLVDTVKDDVNKLSYEYEGETYSFEKVDGTWYDVNDHSKTIEQFKITNMVSMLSPLKASQQIDDVTDMSQFGLANPAMTISWETANSSNKILVGNYNSISDVQYICFESDDTVYTTTSSTVHVFKKTWDDLVEVAEEE